MARAVGSRAAAAACILFGALLAVLVVAPAAALQCNRDVESLSPIFGAAPSPTYVQSSHDVSWKTDGDITRLSLFYGKKDGCIKGVKATYGADAANTHRLGIKSQDLQEHSLRLQPGERFVNADYATSSSCIEYLSLKTNAGRELVAGVRGMRQVTTLAPNKPGAYLAFLNGHTNRKMDNPNVGKLMQLQLVWAASDCSAADVAKAAKVQQQSAAQQPPATRPAGRRTHPSLEGEEYSTALQQQQEQREDAWVPAKCASNSLCKDGRCATSSCLLNGWGTEPPNMACYSTNMRLPVSSPSDTVPCSFLACKLSVKNCTSQGVLGVGGFCAGRVVALTPEHLLHPEGRQWLNYPCVEYKSSSTSAVQQADVTTSPLLASKAWRVCDCLQTASRGGHESSVPVMLPDGAITSYVFPPRAAAPQPQAPSAEPTQPSGSASEQVATKLPAQQPQQQAAPSVVGLPLMPVYEMTSRDVVTQWLVANAGNAALPHTVVPTVLASGLKQLIPGFMLPALLIANTSKPLLVVPEWMEDVPVWVLPNDALPPLRSFLPDLTSLPTLALPAGLSYARVAELLELPDNLRMANLTIGSLPALAASLGLPSVLHMQAPSVASGKPEELISNAGTRGPRAVPLDDMTIGNVLLQWSTATTNKAPLPRAVIADQAALALLQAAVPELTTPCILVPSIALPLLHKPDSLALPMVVVPTEATAAVSAALPGVSSLPSLLTKADDPTQDLPQLRVDDFVAPNMRPLVASLAPHNFPLAPKAAPSAGGDPAVDPALPEQWQQVMHLLPNLLNVSTASPVDIQLIELVVASVREAITAPQFELPFLNLTEAAVSHEAVKSLQRFTSRYMQKAVGGSNPAASASQQQPGQEQVQVPKQQHPQAAAGGDTAEAQQTAQKHTQMLQALGEDPTKQQQAQKPGQKAAAGGKQKPRTYVVEDLEPARRNKFVGPAKPSQELLRKAAYAAEQAGDDGTPDEEPAQEVPVLPHKKLADELPAKPKQMLPAKPPQQQLAASKQQQLAQQLPPPPPPPAPLNPAAVPGFVDEDGAIVISEADLKRAMLSEREWAALSAADQKALLSVLEL